MTRQAFEEAAAATYATLRPHDRETFNKTLGPTANPQTAADFLATAVNEGRWMTKIEPWWTTNANDIGHALQFLTGCTTDEASALITCTVWTLTTIGRDLTVHDVRTHTERANAYLNGTRHPTPPCG